jgi:hypothetical protein
VKFIKKISMGLAIALLCTMIRPTLSASAITNQDNQVNKNTIIGYIDGQAITKNDVDENGRITLQIGSKISPMIVLPPSGYESISPYKEATIEKTLVAPSFSQKTQDIYLSVAHGRVAENGFATSITETAASALGGFIPYCSLGALELTLHGLMLGEVATNIRSFTDYNQQIRLRIISSGYGNFYRVDYWDGKYIDLNVTNNSTTKETVTHTSYRY